MSLIHFLLRLLCLVVFYYRIGLKTFIFIFNLPPQSQVKFFVLPLFLDLSDYNPEILLPRFHQYFLSYVMFLRNHFHHHPIHDHTLVVQSYW